MANQSFTAALAQANPRIYASPILYEKGESEASPLQNLAVDQTLYFLRFLHLNDAKLLRYGHDTASNGPDAGVLDLASSSTVSAAEPYDINTTGITFQLSQLAARLTIRNYTAVALNPDINQVEFQIAAKVRAIRSLYGYQFINGDGSNGQLYGLAALCAPTGLDIGQQVSPTGTDLLDQVDYAIAQVQSGDRNFNQMVIIGNSDAYRKFISLARADNSNPAISFDYCQALGFKTLHYNGIPFCINDHIATTGSDPDKVSNLYIMDLREVQGLVHKDRPDIVRTQVQESASAEISYILSWYVGLTCLNGLGLVELTGWNVSVA